jgi:serine/threonine-protein kinase
VNFFQELKRRNVIRMALLYVVVGWVVLQIADVLFDPLGLPDWTFRLVLGLLLLGFPFALIFAWVFELTPEGLKRERDVDRDDSNTRRTGHKMNAAIVALLALAIVGLVLDRVIPESGPTPEPAAGQTSEPSAEAVAAGAETANTIAVLPFVNISGDPNNEYFSDGLTEELLNTLVRIGGLRVTGRTSSFAFKGQNVDLREIGRLLNVANVLEGSVRKAGNRVRITAQLIKASDGYHLWSDTFDRELTDIFAVQQEIADQVTEALHVTLLGADNSAVMTAMAGQRNPEAYEEYLRGMYIFQRFPDDREALARTRAHFERALARDPDYVDAYWGMHQYWDRMNRNGHGPFEASAEEMQKLTDTLQRLAPGSDRALAAAARTALIGYRYQEAVDFLSEAVQRYPGNATVWSEYASSLSALNENERALEAVNRAVELDPLSLDALRWKSFINYRSGNCEGALEVLDRAVEIEPDVARFRFYAGMCLYETTGEAEAARALVEAETLPFLHDTGLAILLAAQGDRAAAQQRMDAMRESYGDSASYQYGQIYAQWGEPDLALDWLEQAVAIRDTGLIQTSGDRLLGPLQGQPRFQAILKSAGFD